MRRRHVQAWKQFSALGLTGTDRYGGPGTFFTLGHGFKIQVLKSFVTRYAYFVSIRVPGRRSRWEDSIGYLWWQAGPLI